MQIVYCATDEQTTELENIFTNTNCTRVFTKEEMYSAKADAYFYLHSDNALSFSFTEKPIIINSVIETLQSLNAPKNVHRINGWNTFLQRSVWEVVSNSSEEINSIFQHLNKKNILVPDNAGMPSATIVAMIINEAYFALKQQVSSKEEMDTAMKLGTNYPYGPFEWADKIGKKNIYQLLVELCTQDNRYTPCDFLKNEIEQ